MGAQIEGIGSPVVTVHGVPAGDLHGTSHRVVADRVEAATYLAAVGLAGGEITVRDARAEHMEVVLRKLRAMGLTVEPVPGGLRAAGPDRLRSTDVATLPYPGVATDYKPLITAMLSVADGVGIVTENLFAGRFRYVDELIRMGADIRTDSHHAVVRGVPRLVGTSVRGLRHPRRRRPGRGRAGRRRRDHHRRRPPRRPRATRTWSASCGRSAPTSSASTEFSSPSSAALRLAPTRFARQCVGLRCGAPVEPDAPARALRLAPLASLGCVGCVVAGSATRRSLRSAASRRARPRPARLGAWPARRSPTSEGDGHEHHQHLVPPTLVGEEH